MKSTDQCPSTGKPDTLATERRDASASLGDARQVSRATGKAYWRSLDDMVGTREFKDFLQREFPAHASELLDGSRRHFLKIMGASLALAGATTIPGCRRPDHKILAYNTAPEGVIPGKPLYYATAMPLPGGGAEGLLATTFEGRPTKMEGNPLHPYNRGKSSAWAQAHVLDLYDPDRNPAVAAERTDGAIAATSWETFERNASRDFGAFDATSGRGLAFLVQKRSSPSRDRLKAQAMRRWPQAGWYVYEAADRAGVLEGTRAAFGRPMTPEHRLENADTVLCLDHDLLGSDGTLSSARGYAKKRFVPGDGDHRAKDASMSRIYAVESRMTLTGGQADHRLPMKASRIGAFVAVLAQRVATATGNTIPAGMLPDVGDTTDLSEKWFGALLDDLVGAGGSKRGTSVITCGDAQPAWVHALVAMLNEMLGNVGTTVVYRPAAGDLGANSVESITALASAIDAGDVETLVVLDGNPVYDAPADLAFGEKMDGVKNSVFLGRPNATAAMASTYLHVAHDLEAWNDVAGTDGTYSVVQPMIAPLFGGKSDLELLGTLLGEGSDGYTIVRETVAQNSGQARRIAGLPNNAFEKVWRRTLHDGLLNGSVNEQGERPRVNASGVRALTANATGMRQTDSVDAIFQACPKVHDGRWANNGWLQELPEGVSKITWDNPVQMSKATAERLGLNPSRKVGAAQYNEVQVVEVAIGGKTIKAPLWVQPGMPDDQIVLTLGYGQDFGGRIAEGTGTNVYPVRMSGGMNIVQGVEVSRARGEGAYLIATTQDHWSLESRDGIVREVDLYWWKKEGDTNFNIDKDGKPVKDAYKRKRDLKPADMLGIEGHAPNNEEIYRNAPGGRGSEIYYHRVNKKGKAILVDEAGNTFVKNDEGKHVACAPEDGEIIEGSSAKPKGELSRMRPLNKRGREVQQWGMSIDLTTCTGCGTCVTACQAENNIPIVGKKEVAKGREMSWIRVDRYFASDKMDDSAWAEPDMVIQPVACVHCENAPCEVVCPVNATVHSERGTNDMAYNRCIGTRYCSNNCPYKVRRFNYFDYATKKYKGEVYGAPADALVPENTNLVPPRLREKMDEVQTMVNNPNVTVRSRGVMEKCTYCIQRVNAASVETKLEDLKHVPDGFFEVACQQACPTGAIVFGDIYDNEANNGAGSMVNQAKDDPRTYALLAYLAIFPRTTYQMRIRNPHPVIRRHSDHNPFRHAGSLDEHHNGHGHDDHSADQHSALRLPVLNNAIFSGGARA